MIKIFIFTITSLFFSVSNSIAQDLTPKHGVAMHGEVKYQDGFDHFDYVNPDAPKGGILKDHVIGTFDSLNPYILKGSAASGSSLVFQTLMASSDDEAFSEYGLIAETIEIPEDSSFVRFNLRSEAKWHDGKSITPEDVIWTFNTLVEKGNPFYKAYYNDVKLVEKTGERQVTFAFNVRGNRELPLIVGQLPVLPKHFWKDKDFAQTTLEPLLGSGPYKVAQVDAGKRIVYERVKDWWAKDLAVTKGRYNFDQISIDYYRDQTVALEAFFAGEYDYKHENVAKAWATSYKQAKPVLSGDITLDEIAHNRPAGMQAFFMNTRKAVFADRAVREALQYAFDFEWSNKQFAFGTYNRSTSYFENSELASNGLPKGRELEILNAFKDQLSVELFEKEYIVPKSNGSGKNRSNLRKAIQILEQAGYKLGDDKIRVHEDTGLRLSFEIVDNQPAFERWVLPFIQNLKRIGIEASFRVVDSSQYQNRVNAFDYDMTILSVPQSLSPGNEQRGFWHSSKADIQGSRNYLGIKDPVVDALIEKIIKAPSREELIHLTRALDRVLLWGYYVIPQWHINTFRLAYWNKLKRPNINPTYDLPILDTWWVDPKWEGQK